MKETYEQNKRKVHVFNVNDKVWLSAKDIKIHQKSSKLGPRQLGPYVVLERISDLGYKLELPQSLKVHNIFHVDHLNPWHDNGIAKESSPPPVTVDKHKKYEVEHILNSCIFH